MKKTSLFCLVLTASLIGLASINKPTFKPAYAKELPSENDAVRMPAMTLYGDSATTMAFNWNTTYFNDTDLQIVENGKAFTDENIISFKGTVEKSKAANDGFIHRVKATNLTPDTKYDYRFGDAEIDSWCETGSFKTSSLNKKDFTFVHISDPQGWQANHYEEYGKLLKVMKDRINPDFVALTGDVVNNSFSSPALEQWEWALTDQFNVFKDYPVAPVAGNHEVAEYDFSSRYNLNTPDTDDYKTGNYYTFDYEGVHFIGLNTNDTLGQDDPSEATGLSGAQVKWLEEDLKSHQKSRMRIVLMHKGIFDSGTHSSNVGEMQDYDIAYIREQCAPLFTKYNVNLVLQGHDHLFSLSEPTIAKYENGKYSYEVDEGCEIKNINYQGEEIPTYVDLKGTFYLNSGTASGSKYYVPVLQTIPEIHILKTENPGTRCLSVLNVYDGTIVIKTYKVEGSSLNEIYKFAIATDGAQTKGNTINQSPFMFIVWGSIIAIIIVAVAVPTIIIVRKKKAKRGK